MIKAKALLDKMVTHLSDWLIMRRNPEASNGGKVLLGIAEEVTDIEKAIDEYVQAHFISSYINKTHAIDYEYTRIHVGSAEINHLKMIQPDLELITDMQLFVNAASTCNYALLQSNYLYFKTYQVPVNSSITYRYYDQTQTIPVERIAFWNIFDEFALYVGIERLENEDNEQLLSRILYQAQHPVNSSTTGLQNAIANVTGLSLNEVVIEKVDETNYFENDFTGQTLFEQITTLNRDIYRTKRWGIDYWQHDMNYVTYLPHQYDVAPGYYQNGIGDNEDLKIDVTRENELVHLTVKGYQQNENTIEEYYKKYPVETTTLLKLFKPQNTIEPIEINALIEAGTLTEVTDSAFNLTYKALRSVCELVRLQDLADCSHLQPIQETYSFIPNHDYQIAIKSQAAYGSFNAKVTCNENSWLTAQNGFYVNDYGWLSHTAIKLYANQLSYFSATDRFDHELTGFRLKPQYTSGRLELPIHGYQNQRFQCQITPPDYDVLSDSAVSYKYFSKNEQDNSYTSKLHSDALFAIRQTSNHIRFYVEGSAIVLLKTLTKDIEFKVTDDYFETDETLIPVDYLIHVIPVYSNQIITIKELNYTYFKIEFGLEKGEIINQQLPNFAHNTLWMETKTYTNHAPLIGFFYIGDDLSAFSYQLPVFTYTEKMAFDFLGADVLFEITDLTTQTTTVCQQNQTTYQASEAIEIKLNLEQYKTVESLEVYSGGHLLMKKGDYYLKLAAHETCTTLLVKGEAIDFTKVYTLDQLVHKKKNAKYYVSPIAEGFIEAFNQDMKIILPQLPYQYGEYLLEHYEPYVPVFKTYTQTAYVTSCAAPIESFYLKAAQEKTYKAYNKQYLYEESAKGVTVNKNFNPIIPYNEVLLFKVTSLTAGADVYFYNQATATENTYSVDLKPLNYYADFNLSDCLKQDYQEVILPIKLNKHIMLPTYVTTPLGETLDLREHLIATEEGFTVYYNLPTDEELAYDPTYLQTEKFILESDGFKKLTYCHVQDIVYLSFSPYAENATSDIISYELIAELGIIKFSNEFVKQYTGRLIYIHYTIQKPTMLILSTEKLYNIVSVTHEAYLLAFTKTITAPVGEFIFEDESFKNSDYVTVSVAEAGYIATPIPAQSLIRIVESGARDRIAVHQGFYYLEGEEYYLFGTNSAHYEEYKNDHLEAYHTMYLEDGMILQGRSENLIRNSLFNCTSQARIFATDFKELDRVNYFKRFNACEQINLWDHYNMQLALRDGLYGSGIYFGPLVHEAPHFMGLAIEQIGMDLALGFWLKGTATPILYVQEQWEDEMHLTLTRVQKKIELVQEGWIYHAVLPYQPHVFYYLVLEGEGTLDDIILCEASSYTTALHQKNITQMAMPHFETPASPYQRYLFGHQKGYTGTSEMLATGEIVPTSNMSYGYTPLLDKDWMNYATLYNATYSDHCLIPRTEEAYVLTPMIQLTNKAFIKEIIIRPNFLSQEAMPLIVYTGSSEESLKAVSNTVSDVIRLTRFEDYLQIKCSLNHALYSLDVSVSYIEGAIPETYRQNVFESELFDLGTTSEYALEQLCFKHYDQAQVYIRVGKTSHLIDTYQLLPLDAEGGLSELFQLGTIRYLQFKIYFNETCQLDYFDIRNLGVE